jgi:hypothetical protein
MISKYWALVGKIAARGKYLVKTGSSFSVLASYSELKNSFILFSQTFRLK